MFEFQNGKFSIKISLWLIAALLILFLPQTRFYWVVVDFIQSTEGKLQPGEGGK